MVEKKIHLNGVEDIKVLCNAAVKCSCDVDIIAENYIIDAKSFMGIFSLDQHKDMSVRVSGDEAQSVQFFEDIEEILCD